MSDTYGPSGLTGPLPSENQAASPDLTGQWRNWMADPHNRAFLLQTGLQLMQPVGLGQTVTGHVGQAIGAGGEASQRVTEEERAASEQTRKQQDTESRAGLREAQAGAAETRAGAAAQRAQFAGQELDSKIQLRQAQAQAALSRSGLLQARVKDLETRTALYPEDMQARLELNMAKAALIQAQTEYWSARPGTDQFNAQTRRMGTEARAGQGDRALDIREQQGGRGLDIRQQRVDQSGRGLDIREQQGGRGLDIQQQRADTARQKLTTPSPFEAERLRIRGQQVEGNVEIQRRNALIKARREFENAKLLDPSIKDFNDFLTRTGLSGLATPPPPAAAVRRLREQPHLREEFDRKYGSGAAADILGQ